MLDVQDITVAYSSNAEPTIEGFHLEMKPGEICSIVGESGSGKTTVVNMITRLLDVSSGTIRLDGEDITLKKGKEYFRLQRRALIRAGNWVMELQKV